VERERRVVWNVDREQVEVEVTKAYPVVAGRAAMTRIVDNFILLCGVGLSQIVTVCNRRDGRRGMRTL